MEESTCPYCGNWIQIRLKDCWDKKDHPTIFAFQCPICDHILTVTQKMEPIFFAFKEKKEALNF